MTDYLIECCANSLQSAINGEKGGSNRSELCSNLKYGGLTPNKKDIALAKETLTQPGRFPFSAGHAEIIGDGSSALC